MANLIKNGVSWYTHKRKRPIAYSTIAVSNTIALLAERVHPVTPNNILQYIETNGLIGLYEEKDVLLKYVEIGRGDEVLAIRYN